MVRLLPTRHPIRLKNYGYSSEGAYFFTVCVQGRRSVLGQVVDGTAALWTEGQIVQEVWSRLEDRFPSVSTEAFVVMPSHVHGIVMLGDGNMSPPSIPAVGEAAGSMHRAPTGWQPHMTA